MIQTLLWLAGSIVAWGVSAPWYHADILLKNTVGQSPCVNVSDFIDATNTINVTTCNEDVAKGLALILKSTYDFGNVEVKVVVLDKNGSEVSAPAAPATDVTDALQSTIRSALSSNRYFVQVLTSKGFTPLYIEFKKSVVQFSDDNGSDLYGNYNFTAEDAFSQVLNSTYYSGIRVGVTTSKR